MWLRTALPKGHLDAESRDTVKVGIGLIATMTALVLGLVTASAKSSFDSVNAAVKQTSVQILTLDRVLARYGPETVAIRGSIRQVLQSRIEMTWPQGSSGSAEQGTTRAGPGPTAEDLAEAIRALDARNDSQRALRSRALELIESVLQARWFMFVGGETSVPGPFLAILLFWLTITFTSFGLFAPRNATVLTVLFVCAASVSSALFLVLELDGPFDGIIKASAEPLRYALAHINQ
jgi:hypothetical protein